MSSLVKDLSPPTYKVTMNQVTKVTNDPRNPPKMIDLSRDHLTKSQGDERSNRSSKDDQLE